jgi:hypothetical protein
MGANPLLITLRLQSFCVPSPKITRFASCPNLASMVVSVIPIPDWRYSVQHSARNHHYTLLLLL